MLTWISFPPPLFARSRMFHLLLQTFVLMGCLHLNQMQSTDTPGGTEPVDELCQIADLGPVANVDSRWAQPTSLANGAWRPLDEVPVGGFATATCNEGFFLQGAASTECLDDLTFRHTGHACLEIENTAGLSCEDLPDTADGTVVHLTQKTARYQCNAGFVLFGEPLFTCSEQICIDEQICSDQIEIWSIITATNPYGEPPICQALEIPEARVVNVALTLTTTDSSSCLDGTLEAFLIPALEDAGSLGCTSASLCEVVGFACTLGTAPEISVIFNVEQTGGLEPNADGSTEVAEALAEGASGITFDSTPPAGRRRRQAAAATFTVTGVTATVTTMCPAGTANINNNCMQCPAGFGFDGMDCLPCDAGFHSDTPGIVACTACPGSTITQLRGSSNVADCVDSAAICTVAAAVGQQLLSPPPGARLTGADTVTVFCPIDFAVALGELTSVPCSQQPLPECVETCDLLSYTQNGGADLKKRSIRRSGVPDSLAHNEEVRLRCQAGYEFPEGRAVKKLTCEAGNLPNFGKCLEKNHKNCECEKRTRNCRNGQRTVIEVCQSYVHTCTNRKYKEPCQATVQPSTSSWTTTSPVTGAGIDYGGSGGGWTFNNNWG